MFILRKFEKNDLIQNGHISAEKKLYKDSIVGAHSHDFFEFEYIVSGGGSYCIDGVEYEIKDKSLYFMTPVNFHSIDMKDTVFYNVMFSADMCNIEKLSKLFTLKPTVICVDDETDKLFCSLLDELCKYCNNTEYATTILETIIMKICLLSNKENTDNVSSDIRKCELFILENFRGNINLSEAAKFAILSESHFSRKFLCETGKNFKDYLDTIRFDYAKKLLIYSEMTVLQICSECGFNDYPNFVRRFKKKNGISPLEYRNMQRRKSVSFQS